MLQQNVYDPSQPQQTLQAQPQPPMQQPVAATQQGVSYAPAASPWEGVSRVANAMMNGYRAGHPAAYANQQRPDFSDTGVGHVLGSIFGPSMNF